MTIKKRIKKDGTAVYDATLYYGMVDGRRNRRTVTCSTLSQARKLEADAERYRRAVHDRTGALTLGEYVERQYWPLAERRLEATSRDTYEKELRLRILPALGNCRLDAIDRRAVQKMVDGCATRSVARKAVSTLKTILNEAIADGYMSTNPAAAKLTLPPHGQSRDNGLILTDFDQIAYFIAAIKNDGSQAILRLVATGLLLGLRPQERYGLDYEDFDYDARTVTIRRAYVAATGKNGGTQVKRPKTENGARVIPLPPLFVDMFADHQWTGAWIRSDSGARMCPSTAQKAWRRYLDAHPELPPITLENMRHSFATSCIHAGMHVEDLSRVLGHADVSTTWRRYVRPDLKNVREGMDAAFARFPDAAAYPQVGGGVARSSILRASTTHMNV